MSIETKIVRTYLDLLPDLAAGRADIFRLAIEGRARSVMLINVVILGICFGLSNLVGIIGQDGGVDMEGRLLLLLTVMLVIYGIITMFAAMLGFCLIYWAAAKAFGGPGGLITVLELIGLAAVPFWLLAPLLNYTLRFSPPTGISPFLLILLVPAFIWSCKVIRTSMVVGQGLNETRATLAVACMWIFSISAVYVSLP